MEWTPTNIRLLREHLGDSQQAFAKRCGVTRAQTVSEWEVEDMASARHRQPSGTTCKLFDYIAAESGFTETRRRAMKAKRP